MSRVLVIKGANFSANKIRIATVAHYITPVLTTSEGLASSPYLVAMPMDIAVRDPIRMVSGFGVPIPAGAHLIMKDPSLWNIYKIAISTTPGRSINHGTFDTSYSGQPYFRKNVVVANAAVFVLIGKDPVGGSYVNASAEDCELLSRNLLWYEDA